MISKLILLVSVVVTLSQATYKCLDGSASLYTVGGACPSTYKIENGYCCKDTKLTCNEAVQAGPCGFDGSCISGYKCATDMGVCCPIPQQNSVTVQLGPSIAGVCPAGYAIVYQPGGIQSCVYIGA